MRMIVAVKDWNYLRWGLLATVLIAFALPIIQTGFLTRSLESWYLTLIKSPLSTVLYFVYSILTGVLISLYVYNKNNSSKLCNIKKSSRFGVAGTFLGFFVGVCPACIGIVGLILPLSASLTLTYYGWVFMLIAVIIQLLAIRYQGGFKK